MKKLIESENEEELKKQTCYLIEPLDLTLKMIQLNDNNINQPKISLFIHLPVFKTQILKEQYDCIFLILNHITKYKKFQNGFYQMRKFNYFKPKYKISDKKNKENKLSDPKIKNENAVLWFQFAIQMVLKQIKFYKGDKKVFQIPKEDLDNLKAKFMNLFTIYYKGIKNNKNFNFEKKEDEVLFKYIIYAIDISILKNWSNNVIEKVFKEEKIEEKRYAQSSYFSYWFGTSNIDEKKLFTEEEQKKLNELINDETNNNEINKEQNDLQIEFILDEGGIICSKNVQSSKVSLIEGFEIKYEKIHFLFNMNNSLQKFSINSTLNNFLIDLFTIFNKNKRRIPLTFKDITNKEIKLGTSDLENNSIDNLSLESKKSENNFISLKFTYTPLEDINSSFWCHTTELNILYHQVFLQRVIEFFTVNNINEDMVNNAYDKYKNLTIQTKEAINHNISKKNIFQINIDPRSIIIPLNKYDFSNSKVLIVQFGNIKMDNNITNDEFDEKYPKKYFMYLDSLSIDFYKSMKNMKNRKNKIEVLTDVSGEMGIAILNKKLYSTKENPPIKLLISINNITLKLTEYIYTILIQLSNILKPTKEKDLWNQLITNKEDIAKNAKVTALILKKNWVGSNYENFLAMISGGYIYFYKSGQDEEYSGYFYLKDTVLNPNKDNLSIQLQNDSGIIEIKFRNESKFKSWEKCLRERINEMTESNQEREEILEDKVITIDKEEINFGVECIFKSVNLILIHENNFDNLFQLSVNTLKYFNLK